MSNSKLEYPPGVLKVDSLLTAQGRYVDADKIRFIQGKAQTIGGWARYYNTTVVPGVSRAEIAWTDVSGNTFLVIGSTIGLYCLKNSTEPLIDITPVRSSAPTGNLGNNPFTTTINTSTVKVTHTGHSLSPLLGQGVAFASASTFNGVNMNNGGANPAKWYVTRIIDANNYEVSIAPTLATASGAGGGATPPTFTYDIEPGNANNVGILTGGWGTTGGWGLNAWGGGSGGAGLGEPRVWGLDLWGSFLTANYNGSTLYSWDTIVAKATAVANAPSVMRKHVVTESRFILCLATSDPLLIEWQDQNTLTSWTPGLTNTAGSRRLQGGTRIVNGCVVQALGNLIWTDTSVFLVTYTGSRFVFDSQVAGKDCGLVGPKAFVVANTVPYWMGPQGFHRWQGYVEDIPRQEEVWNWFAENINKAELIKSFAHYDVDFGEVTWWFPSIGSTEPDKYLKLSLEDFSWTPGTMSRTAVTSFKLAETRPFMMSYDGRIYLHEIGATADGAIMPWYLQAAPMEIEDGGRYYDVNGYMVDFKRVQGQIDIQLDTYNRIPDSDQATPLETQVRTFNGAAMEGVVDFSANGRAIGVRLSSNVINTSMRLGTAMLDVGPRGTRR